MESLETVKYYTPSIEEFHVGFEYESSYDTQGSGPWTKRTIDNTYDLDTVGNYEQVRVKYLDQEDIESLGFVEQEYYRKVDNAYFKRMFFKQVEGSKGSVIWFNADTRLAEVWDYTDIDETNLFDNWNMHSFRGFVKNKSELKSLLNQLNINHE